MKYTWEQVKKEANAEKGKWFYHPDLGVQYPTGWELVTEEEVAESSSGSYARATVKYRQQLIDEADVPANINIEGFSLRPDAYRVTAYAQEVIRLSKLVTKMEEDAAALSKKCAACNSDANVSPRSTQARRYGSFTVKLCQECYDSLRHGLTDGSDDLV